MTKLFSNILNHRKVLSAIIIGTVCAASPALSQDEQPNYDLEQIKPGIYRTTQGPYHGIIVEGETGLLILDTFNEDFSKWLDNKLTEEFNKPIKYVIYSHNHSDHISGGQAFAHHNPVYIAHDLAKDSMERMKRDTHYPEISFSDSLSIDLDGRPIKLQYWGNNDGLGSISMYLPQDKFIAAIDWALTDRVGYQHIKRYNVDGIIASLYEIDKLDWDVISPGHASTGTKEDVRRFRRYMEAIRDGVIAGILAGKNEDTIVSEVHASIAANEEFATLKMFDQWSEMNVRGIYQQIAAKEGILE